MKIFENECKICVFFIVEETAQFETFFIYHNCTSFDRLISISVSLSMVAITGINGYIKFGKDLKLSVLETLSTTTLLHCASVLVAVQLCLSSAISNAALYQHMEESLNISRGDVLFELQLKI